MQVGVIGLGNIGGHVASNLVTDGHDVVVFDVDAERAGAVAGARLTMTGHHLVEAPLTGGAIGAERRMLSFMVGGDDDAVARVQPVLEPLGRAFVHLGALGLGNTMKLVNSLVAFTTTWVSLEGLSLAAKSGIPVQQAVD